MTEVLTPDRAPERGWPRAAVLLGVLFATSVGQPVTFLAVAFLVVAGLRGVRGTGVVFGCLLAVLVAVSGVRDGIWYVERAWAVIVASCFVAVSMLYPKWRFSGRAMGAVWGAAVVAAFLLVGRAGAWSAIDWAVSDRIMGGVDAVMDSFLALRGGEALSPALMAAIYETAEAQTALFPALTGIASMAGLAVASWVYTRLTSGGDQGLGPVRDFRFNDHLVWLLIAGVVLLVTRWSEPLFRVGANTVTFMGALYAMRGVAVVVFVSGGVSVFGYLMTGIGLVIVPPVVIGGALVIGIGDTWLNVRNRVQEVARSN